MRRVPWWRLPFNADTWRRTLYALLALPVGVVCVPLSILGGSPHVGDMWYGIAVAKLAGLPPAVVSRAKSVLAKLEAGRDATGGIAAGLDDLPLFAAAAQAEEESVDPVHAALADIDADALSPREALDLVYRLKRIAAEAG